MCGQSARSESGPSDVRDILRSLQGWVPNSANWERYPGLTTGNINAYPELLAALIEAEEAGRGESRPEFRTFPTSQFGHKDPDFTLRLGELLEASGSDKTRHDYHRVYADLFFNAGREGAISVLEIGLGTNDPDVPSTMGVEGTPGASLRAFRDALPEASVFGADVDRDCLISEKRIRTAWVDQMDRSSLDALPDALGMDTFDVIIDDGLHSVSANLATLLFAMKRLRPKGAVVIEDIHRAALPAWRPVALTVQAQFDSFFVQAARSWMFVMRRRR